MSADSEKPKPLAAATTVRCSIPEGVARLIDAEAPPTDPTSVPLFLSLEVPVEAERTVQRGDETLGEAPPHDLPARRAPSQSGLTPRHAGRPGTESENVRLREIARFSQPSRYQELDVVGRGGMGVVHRVVDRVLGREAAMKVIEGPLATRPVDVLRFLEEAQITGQLDHPGIVPVHDFGLGSDGSRAYFTMKLVRGDTLSHLIHVQQAFGLAGRALERLLGTFLRVCEAVSFAHARCVVHRDLKPDNVLVGTHGQVYVMDWGLARVIEGGRPSEGARPIPLLMIAGTPSFMAPEQAQGRVADIDARTDVFGLGGILYAILTGHGPFHSDDPELSLERARRCEVPTLDDTDDGVPPELARIAMKALSKEPAARYQSAEDLARDVEEFLRGGGWFSTRRYEPGEVIIAEGEPGSAAYVLVEGRCEVWKTIDGQRTKLRTLEPGDVFGETAVFTSKPRSATVIAVDAVAVKLVTRESLERELDRNPWMGAFVRAVAERFREADEKLSRR